MVKPERCSTLPGQPSRIPEGRDLLRPPVDACAHTPVPMVLRARVFSSTCTCAPPTRSEGSVSGSELGGRYREEVCALACAGWVCPWACGGSSALLWDLWTGPT